MSILKFKSQLKTTTKREIDIQNLTWDVVESRDIAIECLKGLPYVKMHYDIDLKLSENGFQMEKDVYDRTREEFFKILEVNSAKHNFLYTKFASRAWRSSTDGKISTHIIFQNKFLSRSTCPEKSYLNDHFLSTVFDGYPEESKLWLNAIDTSIYSNGIEKDNVFRMVGKGDKSGKKTHHYPMNDSDPVSLYLLTPTTKFHLDNDVLTLYSEVNVVEVKEEKKDKSEPKPRGRPKKVNIEPLKRDALEKMFLALDAEKRAHDYKPWSSLLLLCKTLLGDEGLGVFLELSEESKYEDYDEYQATSAYERAVPNGEYTEGSLIHWLKEDNPDALAKILKESGHGGREGYDVVYYETYSSDFMKDLVKLLNQDGLTITRDNSRIWIRQILDPVYRNRWISVGKDELSQYLIPRVEQMRIARMTMSGDETVLTPIHKDLNFLEKNVWRHLLAFIPVNPTFDTIFTSSITKLCFSNGVLDFTNGQFTTWKNNIDVHSKVVIPYDYYYKRSEHEPQIEEIIATLIEYFGDNAVSEDNSMKEWQRYLRIISRILAGCPDKLWQLWSSDRNSGKSALLEMLAEVFTGYIQTFNSGAIMTQKMNMKGDPSRELGYWVSLADSGCRLAYCQETQKPQAHSNTELINSRILKLLVGRDALKARSMYQDESTARTVNHQMSIVICDNPYKRQATSEDVFQTCSLVTFKRVFLDADAFEKSKSDGRYNPDITFQADRSKQERLKKYRLAWVHLVVRYFSNELYPVLRTDGAGEVRDEDSKEDNLEADELLRHFNTHFVKDNTSYVSNLNVSKFCTSHDVPFLRTVVIPRLEAIGGFKTNRNKGVDGKAARGWKGVRYIPCKECQESLDDKISE